MFGFGDTSRRVVIFVVTLHGVCVVANSQESAKETARREDRFGMTLPGIDGPQPWSEKPILNDDGRFHFAIVTDRTGGHRPGVWMDAVRKLNHMRPEFVVSVGDLIEGYTRDEQLITSQWKEFLGFIDQLEMRFFFVAGNHDVTNPLMHKMWRERFGPEWYSFDYKDAHFLCLSSEDPQDKIGQEQLEWIERDLANHRDARWTFVFLHKPLWVYAELRTKAGKEDPTNWKKVESLLGERPHTVFSGHVHHYVQFDRNGAKYYHLATTGGGSRLRGRRHGEFDHVVWMTMESDGPRMANLKLDGILAPDAVTETGIARYRKFLADSTVHIAPILVDHEAQVSSGVISLRIKNASDDPVLLTGTVSRLPQLGLTFAKPDVNLTVGAREEKTVDLDFQLAEPLSFEHFARTVFEGILSSTTDSELVAELKMPVTIDRRYNCPPLEIQLDGRLPEWNAIEKHETGADALVIEAADQWQGPEDASIQFGLAHDREYLLVGGNVTDDRVTAQDRVYVIVDGRPMESRMANRRLGQDAAIVEGAPTVDGRPGRVRDLRQLGTSRRPPRGAMRQTDSGYSFELMIPVADLMKQQGGVDWNSCQLTVVVSDSDDATDNNCFIVWRGTSEVRRFNTNYAHVFRQKAEHP